jgi:hypothetical protein
MRQPAARVKPRLAKLQSFPAPIGGWIKNVNLATPDARRPDGSKVNGAAVLENWFPTATGIRMRGGSALYTITVGDDDIVSLFTYVNGNNRALFAATETELFDITAATGVSFLVDDLGNNLVDDLGNFIVVGSSDAAVSSLAGGDWSSVQFATSGGTFLRIVNGVDTPLIYDGATWSTTPAITGVTPEALSNVWSFKNRLFFVEKDSLNAWYLPVDSIGGLAAKFPLGGVFTRGGALLFGASWSLDTGGGLNEQCVFFSTEGEVAVYQGTNPADAAAWTKVGVYRIGRPKGPKAFIRAGGDLVIATDIGLIPLSVAVQRDLAALSPSAVSYPIETAWNEEIAGRTANWHCEVWPTKQMVVVALPTPSGSQPLMFVANARTGAWAYFTGWDTKCVVLFGDRLFFGSSDGKVVEAEATGSDQDAAYTATVVPLFDPLKSPASLKNGLLARATVRAPSDISVQLSLQSDYEVSLPAPPDDTGVSADSTWGTAVWGSSVWGSEVAKRTFRHWQSIAGTGYALSVAAQVTSGSLSQPDIELVQIDMTFDMADIVS